MTDVATPFLQRLAAPVTASMRAAVEAWKIQESGRGEPVGNNPWNLHAGRACSPNARAVVMNIPHSQALRLDPYYPGLIGNRWAAPSDRNVAIYDTLPHGCAAAAQRLLEYPNNFGYGLVVKTAKQGDALGFLGALAASSWSASRYRSQDGRNLLLSIFASLGGETEEPDSMTNLFPITVHRMLDLPKDTVLYEDATCHVAFTTLGTSFRLGLISASGTAYQVADGDHAVWVPRDIGTIVTADRNVGK